MATPDTSPYRANAVTPIDCLRAPATNDTTNARGRPDSSTRSAVCACAALLMSRTWVCVMDGSSAMWPCDASSTARMLAPDRLTTSAVCVCVTEDTTRTWRCVRVTVPAECAWV